MPRDTIAIIEPFVVPQLQRRYVDFRDLPLGQKEIVFQLWCDHQRRRLAQLPGNLPPCHPLDGSDDRRLERRIARFGRAAARRPGLTLEQFEDEGRDREFITDPLHIKAQAFLACRDMTTNEWIGGVPFSNITIERRVGNRIEASVFMATATPKHPDFSRARTNAIGTRFLLNNDLPLRNGKILDIVQWDFRLPKEVEAAVLADPSIIQNFTQLGTEFDVLGGPGSAEPDTHIRYRRKGIAAAPPDIEPPLDPDV